MIRYLKVEGLNNKLDAEFEFNEDLNIFTGTNGSSKTTLLKLIWYLISGNIHRIVDEISFKTVSVGTDVFSLSINRLGSGEVEFTPKFNAQEDLLSKPFVVSFGSSPDNLTPMEKEIKLEKMKTRISYLTKGSIFFPTFRRIEEGFSTLFRDMPPKTGTRLVSPYQLMGKVREFQDALSELSSDVSVHNHRFIVSISTNDIASLLKEKYIPISKKIDELQTNVLHDIAQKTKENPVSKEEYERQTPQKKHYELNDIQKWIEQVTTERQDLLQPFILLSNLTRNMLQYEAIHITGKIAYSEDTEGITLGVRGSGILVGKVKDSISSDKLSSGEKQMLGFLCYNAFYDNTPIFIDEPELSLHVDWQRRLFPTLMEQGQNNQFFVATHSPFIYTKYPDKEFMLDEDRGES